jgi:ribonucleoside-diphosphate reductase alpha chain
VTDDFMTALAAGRKWPLRFPAEPRLPTAPGYSAAEPADAQGAVLRLVAARALWEQIVDAAYTAAEPGVLFVDRINRGNNLYYCERIAATNPCGEIPLPPNGACVLGSVNLTAFVRRAFGADASLDFAALEEIVPTAVRMLDDAVELSLFPLERQAAEARATHRVGLGITGLADTLIMLGLRYDAPAGRELARRVLECIRDAAYRASSQLAAEKGSFERFECDAYLAGEYTRSLPTDVRDDIAQQGLRNSHLLAIAPAGTISLLANNVSSGIEPVFALEGERRVLDENRAAESHPVRDYAYAVWSAEHTGALPPAFVTAAGLSPHAHLEMLAALQPLVDNSIAKTINVPADVPRGEFASIFERAYALGVKGCTVFRPNAVTGAVLTVAGEPCCRPH